MPPQAIGSGLNRHLECCGKGQKICKKNKIFYYLRLERQQGVRPLSLVKTQTPGLVPGVCLCSILEAWD
jgi:hypothetical protein